MIKTVKMCLTWRLRETKLFLDISLLRLTAICCVAKWRWLKKWKIQKKLRQTSTSNVRAGILNKSNVNVYVKFDVTSRRNVIFDVTSNLMFQTLVVCTAALGLASSCALKPFSQLSTGVFGFDSRRSNSCQFSCRLSRRRRIWSWQRG